MNLINSDPALNPDRNILWSYHYFRRFDLKQLMAKIYPGFYPRLILDSGAWSAFKLGAKINLNDFIAYVHANKQVIWWYSNLDDMLDHRITLSNQLEMERQGLCPVPVFHTGEPWHVLDQYMNRYPRKCSASYVAHQ